MTGPLQMALTVGPLAGYLFVLGVWQSGRHPRVVAGALDFGLLAFGLGGLLVFGPIGHTLVGLMFPGPSVWAWLALPSLFLLLVLVWLPGTSRRLVVYNIDPETIAPALAAGLATVPGRFVPTLTGFEDADGRRGVSVEGSRWSRTAVVEAHGDAPEALIHALRPALEARLGDAGVGPSAVAWLWFGLSCASLLAPWLLLALARPQVREAVSTLLHLLHGD